MSKTPIMPYFEMNQQSDYNRTAQYLEYKVPETLITLFMPFINRKKPILDIGCGTGAIGFLLKDENLEVHGVDFSKENLKFVNKDHYNFLLVTNATHLPFPKKTYHNIISAGLYGDFLRESDISELILLADENATIGIAGLYYALSNVHKRLIDEGFTIVCDKIGYAQKHFNQINSTIQNRYVVAKR